MTRSSCCSGRALACTALILLAPGASGAETPRDSTTAQAPARPNRPPAAAEPIPPVYELDVEPAHDGLAASARRWSLYGTILPIAAGATHAAFRSDMFQPGVTLAVAGLCAGPSLGYFRGNLPGRGVAGAIVRTGSLGLFTLSGAFVIYASGYESHDDTDLATGIGIALLCAGGAITATSAVWDIQRVDDRVREGAAVRRAQVGVVPALIGDDRSPGFAIRARF